MDVVLELEFYMDVGLDYELVMHMDWVLAY